MKYTKALLFLFFESLAILCKSQDVKITPVPLLFDPSVTNVVGMCQDDNGFIWFADNYNGLIKYDGTSKKYFRANPNDSNSLHTNRLECLSAGIGGIIWIGSYQEGLDRLDTSTETFTHFQNDPADPHSLRNNQVQALLEDRTGTLWIGTTTGLDTLDRKTGHFIHIRDDSPAGRHINVAAIRSIYEDQAGRIWIGAGHPFNYSEDPASGLYQFDKKSGLITQFRHDPEDPTSLIGNRVGAMFEDSNGNFYVGTDGDGLHLMNRVEGTFQRLLNNPNDLNALSRPPVNPYASYALDHITFINEDFQGSIWIGTYAGGINRYNPKTKTMEFFGKSEVGSHYLEKNDFWTLLKTRDNHLWVSGWEPETENQVLYKISTIQNQFDYTQTGIRSVVFAQGQDSGVWIGTSRGLLGHGVDQSKDSFFTFVNKTIGTVPLRYMTFDQKSNLWVADLLNGVYYFERSSMSYKFYGREQPGKKGLSNSVATVILPKKDGNTWIGTNWGLDFFNPKIENFIHYQNEPSNPNSLSANPVYSLLEDSKGRVWIGTAEGLNLYREESDDFQRFLAGTGITVMGINEDSKGRIWASTFRSGFYLLDQETGVFNPYNDNTGLITDMLLIAGVVEDESKFLWLFTDIGLIRLNPETRNAALFGKSWKNTPESGLFSYHLFLSKENEIFIGHSNGFFSFRPAVLEKQYPNQPIPYWAGFYLGNHKVTSNSDKKILPANLNETQEIRLPYDQNTFTLEFGTIDFVTLESEKNIRYRLENYDQNWRSGASNSAYYFDLPQGEYVFHVQATNRYGNLGQKSLKLIVMPPWFTQWWAWLSYGVLLFFFLYFVYRFLLRRKLAEADFQRLKEMDLVKTRLYTNLTHEFRTPLTVISGIADHMMDDPSSDSIKEGLPMIKRNTSQLLRLINQMLDLAKLESGSMPTKMIQDDIIQYLKYLTESFHSFSDSKDIRIHLLPGIEELYMDFDPEKIQAIFSNLVGNAVKFTPQGGNIYLKIEKRSDREKREFLEIKVKDTGKGIKPEHLPYVFDRFYQVEDSSTRSDEGTGIGLALTKELVQLMSGTIEVSSQVGKGSEFTLMLPIQNKAPKGSAGVFAQEIEVVVKDLVEEFVQETEEEYDESLPLALLIEDNEDVLSYLELCLHGKYRVQKARNGLQGIQRAHELTPDIIICDVMMPEKDGYEVVEMLKNEESTSHIPIILLTAKADMDSRLEGLERGADAYLAKPFEKKELDVRLRKLIELRLKLQNHFLESLHNHGPDLRGEKVELHKKSKTEKSEESHPQSIPLANSLDHAFVLKVRKVIQENLDDSSFGVEQLCRELALSHSQVHRKLIALTGLSATHFIRYVRLVHAKELLKKSWITITSISHDCGFAEPAYFSRVFKKEFGISPQEWREQNCN